MSNENEHTQESDYVVYEPDLVQSAKTLQCAMEILESHDSLDESYQDISEVERFQTAVSIMYRPELQGLPDPLLRQRLKLYFEVKPVRFIGEHHFSKPSAECIKTYRAGNFFACTMMTQSVNEGIINFVAERNSIKAKRGGNLPLTIDEFVKHGLFTNEAAQASKVICERDERNDIHHMKPEISQIEDWHELAKRNLRNLAKVETCVFGNELVDAAICPRFPQHWDSAGEDLVHIHMR